MIRYSGDEALVDHKGRSKPIYRPRNPKPETWRPKRPARLFLGILPGSRLMAFEGVKNGLPYAILGLLSIAGAFFVGSGLARSALLLESLHIDRRWLLCHAAGVVALVTTYELLRLGAALEERTSGPRTPRVIAAFLLPCLLILCGGPRVVALLPRVLEAAWFASLVFSVLALTAAVWCVFEGTLTSRVSRKRFRMVGGLVVALLLGVLFLSRSELTRTRYGAAAIARDAGFRVLPGLLRP